METEWIMLADIETGERKRPLNQQHVDRLVTSIKDIGLQTPITVLARKDEDGWRSILVVGAHRLAALRQIGVEGAQCFILPDDPDTAELWEIEENLARAELSDAERASHHTRREAILVGRGIVAEPGRGGDRTSNEQKVRSYSAQTAAALGIHEKTVRQDLRRGKKIDADVLADVAGTALDKGAVLDELARTPREDQHAKVIEIRDRQEADKLNRYADKAVARTNAEEAADIIHGALDLDQVDALMARLASVSMKDFLGALNMRRAA